MEPPLLDHPFCEGHLQQILELHMWLCEIVQGSNAVISKRIIP